MKVSKINCTFRAEEQNRINTQTNKLEDPLVKQYEKMLADYQLKMHQVQLDCFEKLVEDVDKPEEKELT